MEGCDLGAVLGLPGEGEGLGRKGTCARRCMAGRKFALVKRD